MRAKISVLALTTLLILGLSLTNALAANSVTYLGKTTWTATVTDSSGPHAAIGATFTITGGISKVGDEFYQFQGYVKPGDDGPFVVSGSGFMNGTTLEFTLSESQKHTDGWRDSGVMHVSIDRFSFDGTVYDIGHDFDTSTRAFNERFTAGTLTCTGGAIPLGQAQVAPQFLLLQ